MRLAFLLAILALALLYTFHAFAGLSFLSSTGRLGPGFFPRIVGLLLIATCVYTIIADRQRLADDGALSDYWRTPVLIAALSGVFVALLNVLGGLLAMVVFMLASLFILNRGRPVQNVVVSLALPLSVYLLFETWLNAAVPEGIVPLPF